MRKPTKKLTDDEIVLRIMQCLKSQGKTEKELIDAIGLANGTFTAWKYKHGKSFMLHLDDIADYLDVTSDYLIKGIDEDVNMEVMTGNEIQLIKMFREIDYSRQNLLLQMAECLKKATKYELMDAIISNE